ncbi:MAG: GDSL family lipase [Gammaproteobacteria bacterium]|nr:GDSL family lipase [Gammaproteobacteria bacterium]MBU1819712.1 GDSL family lipase [Gammaproteobacteria bacterium]
MPLFASMRPIHRAPASRLSALARRLALSGLLAASISAPAQTALPAGYSRWQASMDAFSAADKLRLPQQDGVLFVGSSSIRFWAQLAQDFEQVPVVINRGFGGSTMDDCHYFAQQLVVQYRPRQVMIYAGDNDLAEGRTPAQVLESFQGFVRAVRAELPHARIGYISIKPSPARTGLLPQVRETNALLKDYVGTLPNADYIDIYHPMLNAQDQPRSDLYGPDRLHMNAAGYALWRGVIGPYVMAPADGPGKSPVLTATAAPSSHPLATTVSKGVAVPTPVSLRKP